MERNSINFKSAIIGAVIGGVFVMIGSYLSIKMNYSNQLKFQTQEKEDKIYFDLHSILQEIADNFEFSFHNDEIFSDNRKIYERIIELNTIIKKRFGDKPLIQIKELADTVLTLSIRRPNQYGTMESNTIRKLAPPNKDDTLLFSVYSAIKNYYSMVNSFNSRFKLYLEDLHLVKDSQYISTLSAEYANRIYSDLAMQERLLERKAKSIYNQGGMCAFILNLYLTTKYNGPHPPIVSNENEKVKNLMVDTLKIKRYKVVEIPLDEFMQTIE